MRKSEVFKKVTQDVHHFCPPHKKASISYVYRQDTAGKISEPRNEVEGPQGLRDLGQQLEGEGVTILPALLLPEARPRLPSMGKQSKVDTQPPPPVPRQPLGSPLIGITGEIRQAFPLRIRQKQRKEAKITATSNQLLAKHILEFLLILKQSWAVCQISPGGLHFRQDEIYTSQEQRKNASFLLGSLGYIFLLP